MSPRALGGPAGWLASLWLGSDFSSLLVPPKNLMGNDFGPTPRWASEELRSRGKAAGARAAFQPPGAGKGPPGPRPTTPENDAGTENPVGPGEMRSDLPDALPIRRPEEVIEIPEPVWPLGDPTPEDALLTEVTMASVSAFAMACSRSRTEELVNELFLLIIVWTRRVAVSTSSPRRATSRCCPSDTVRASPAGIPRIMLTFSTMAALTAWKSQLPSPSSFATRMESTPCSQRRISVSATSMSTRATMVTAKHPKRRMYTTLSVSLHLGYTKAMLSSYSTTPMQSMSTVDASPNISR
mmetsp:Transcript_50141/g.160592  ORF Transcript_50141/g.160592 Transcript_50141/m.160592 type:complete len:297 (-) Transcript_50141:574-1464(-)